MILKTSQNQKVNMLVLTCGDSYSLIEKINNNLFGSPVYLVKSISPSKGDLDFVEYADLVYCSIELRKKGWRCTLDLKTKNTSYCQDTTKLPTQVMIGLLTFKRVAFY